MHFVEGKPWPTVTDTQILGFFREYRFLSNFWQAPVEVDGVTYASSEHAYMAQKTNVPEEKAHLATSITSAEARAYGQKVTLRPDWDDVRIDMMHKVVLAKFSQNPSLKAKLLATGGKYLEETGYWGDTFWGVCKGVGENHLGNILMKVRNELKNQGH